VTVSMAEVPNPETFGSWEDAFKYPVAAIRGMERQLRRDIDTNKERLRSLVGYFTSILPKNRWLTVLSPVSSASYRDLLGTAESIIQMDGRMQDVEVHLGSMSSKCNARLLEIKASSMTSWDTKSGVAG